VLDVTEGFRRARDRLAYGVAGAAAAPDRRVPDFAGARTRSSLRFLNDDNELSSDVGARKEC
jgi:hypothetical protein